jgi:hypothetical protein
LGAKNEGQRPEEVFKFRVSEMLFPENSVSYVEIYNLLAI